jgi:2-dehydro-3-deoxyphosphogluconate aldolase/(4S)-4-hydroxy-2-oxoglutarate aldolase
MSKKKINSKKPVTKQNPYFVDKLAKIPGWFKAYFLKFWVVGASFYLVYMSFELVNYAYDDKLFIYLLILTIANEYIVNNLVRYMNTPSSPTYKYMIHYVKRKSIFSILTTLLYTLIMVILNYLVLNLWTSVFGLHTIDYYLSDVDAGPIGFSLCFVALDVIYVMVRNFILRKILRSKKYIEKEKIKKLTEEKRMDAIKLIKETKIVAVVRATSTEQAVKMAGALYDGGIRTLEITFTVPNASSVIIALNDYFSAYQDKPLIGAGTVTTLKEAKAAFNSKSSFIVGPGFSKEVAIFCKKNNVTYIPGVLTPTEIMEAQKYGCKVIKLFPGSAFGVSYVKSLKGPFPSLEIMPTGGVDLDNINDWFDAGVIAVGIGSELTKPASKGDYKGTTALATEFLKKIGK